jgi:hypothetical protein
MQNSLNVLFESKLQHLVSLIKNNGLYVRKVDVASLNMVKYSTCGTDEEFNTSFQFTDLGLDRNTTINSQTRELIWRMFQVLKSV